MPEGRRSRTQCAKRRSDASERTPRSAILAHSPDWPFDSTERSATSTPTSSPTPLHVDSFTCSTKHAASTSTGHARYHSTSVGCDTSAAGRSGAWRFTPTATNAMSRAHSPTAPSTALPRRRSKWVPFTCACDQASLALGHGRSGLPNITLQRSRGLALLARGPLSVDVDMTSAVKHVDAGIGRAVASLGLVPDFVDAGVSETVRQELCGGIPR
jgi:hypothetical protein